MRQYSERQSVIRELFTLLLLQHDDDTDDIITQMFSLPGSPTIGALLFSDDPEMMLVVDMMFNDEAEIGELLQAVTSSRQTVRDVIRRLQASHTYNKRGLPVPHQLALALERLGSNGNGASVGRCARNLNIARGTVIKVTRRVIEAITSLGPQYVVWPNESRRREISEVMKQEGFEGCVGFVDGTTIRLFQRPAIDGHVFWDRKKQYSINCQIVCDCDRYITCFMTGWPGSCGDSMVYKRMALYESPGDYFDAAQ
ncbi:hypothetical protein PSTG_13929 [Puccinia striiformis f. sp. tritici PST-78]|uniref:DDE Tnp4 domain-containing protein n=1 Tax=Puccinia striiformis f. sp. tritici PST-78 TaxID=1165861 RepID=A0A0L0V047_9BASI|nr:hypothetical protein PSTG_13929 [Puccinia striiformis f. sp. tritici PST-78]